MHVTFVVLLVVAVEKVFHAWRETHHVGTAIARVWHGRERSNIVATILCIGLAFSAWNLFSAVNRHLANGRLARWLTNRE